MELKFMRKKIDNIDNELLRLIAERLVLAKQIAEIKKNHNLPLEDKKREEELLEARIKQMKELGYGDAEFVKGIYTAIMSKSKQVQKEAMQ